MGGLKPHEIQMEDHNWRNVTVVSLAEGIQYINVDISIFSS